MAKSLPCCARTFVAALVLPVATGVSAIVTGCSDGSFDLATPDAATDAPAETAVDTGVRPDVADTGPPTAAGATFCNALSISYDICDDFENGTFGAWSSTSSGTTGGSLTVANGIGRANSYGLRIQKSAPGSDRIALISSPPTAVTGVSQSFALAIDSANTDSTNSAFVSLVLIDGIKQVGIAVYPQPGSDTFNVKLYAEGAAVVDLGILQRGVYANIKFDVVCTAHSVCTASAQLNGGQAVTAATVLSDNTQNVAIVGLDIGSGGAAYDIRMDNIVLDWRN
jgi:hypothetical protein